MAAGRRPCCRLKANRYELASGVPSAGCEVALRLSLVKSLAWAAGIAVFGLMLYTCAVPGHLRTGRTGEGLAGTYTVNGVDPLGTEYSGTVIITATDIEARYEIEWIVTGAIHRGTGGQDGSRFVVDWTSVATAGGSGAGTGIYTIKDDGRLVGTRSVDGVDDPGTEEIFPEW